MEQSSGLKNLLPLFVVALLLTVTPGIAHAADPGVGPLERIIDILTGDLVRLGAVLTCIIMGLLAWAGHLQMRTVFNFVLGIVLIFGSATIADIFIGEV